MSFSYLLMDATQHHSSSNAMLNGYQSAMTAQAYGAASLPDRDALIESHLPQVKYIAARLVAKLPASVDRDDLIGAGVLGLIDAVAKFDPTRGVLFKSFAELRVRGAMIDSLREQDWAPRSLRRRSREVEDAYHRIEQEHGRVAEEEEVARELNLSLPEFHALLGELCGLSVKSYDSSTPEDDTSSFVRQLPDDLTPAPDALYEKADSRLNLLQAIDRLPQRERQVVALYYLEELTMKEVGVVLGITESRVSQLHTQAVLRLRGALNSVS